LESDFLWYFLFKIIKTIYIHKIIYILKVTKMPYIHDGDLKIALEMIDLAKTSKDKESIQQFLERAEKYLRGDNSVRRDG